jgi:hypothetical protein
MRGPWRQVIEDIVWIGGLRTGVGRKKLQEPLVIGVDAGKCRKDRLDRLRVADDALEILARRRSLVRGLDDRESEVSGQAQLFRGFGGRVSASGEESAGRGRGRRAMRDLGY